MQYTDRDRFSNLNLMQHYGGMPVAQLNGLMDAQDRIRKNDPPEAAKHTSLQSSVSAVKDLAGLAAASAESPFYEMDRTSPFPPEQQKWNGFVSKFGQALEDWRQNNGDRIPTDMQKREIAQGILFPNGAPGQQQTPQQATAKPTEAATPTATETHRPNGDPFSLWVAQQLEAHDKVVSDDTIAATKKALLAKNPNIEKEYQGITLVPAQKAANNAE
ncbi:MAG: hypothetical protein ABSF52_06265 [Syntrophobacteraceae bacterium]|jgi:hypothetical protein